MNSKYVSLVLCLQLSFVFCATIENSTTIAAAERSSSSNIFARKARSTYNFVYADLIGCVVSSDPSCFVNVAEDFLYVRKNELLGKIFFLSTVNYFLAPITDLIESENK